MRENHDDERRSRLAEGEAADLLRSIARFIEVNTRAESKGDGTDLLLASLEPARIGIHSGIPSALPDIYCAPGPRGQVEGFLSFSQGLPLRPQGRGEDTQQALVRLIEDRPEVFGHLAPDSSFVVSVRDLIGDLPESCPKFLLLTLHQYVRGIRVDVPSSHFLVDGDGMVRFFMNRMVPDLRLPGSAETSRVLPGMPVAVPGFETRNTELVCVPEERRGFPGSPGLFWRARVRKGDRTFLVYSNAETGERSSPTGWRNNLDYTVWDESCPDPEDSTCETSGTAAAWQFDGAYLAYNQLPEVGYNLSWLFNRLFRKNVSFPGMGVPHWRFGNGQGYSVRVNTVDVDDVPNGSWEPDPQKGGPCVKVTQYCCQLDPVAHEFAHGLILFASPDMFQEAFSSDLAKAVWEGVSDGIAALVAYFSVCDDPSAPPMVLAASLPAASAENLGPMSYDDCWRLFENTLQDDVDQHGNKTFPSGIRDLQKPALSQNYLHLDPEDDRQPDSWNNYALEPTGLFQGPQHFNATIIGKLVWLLSGQPEGVEDEFDGLVTRSIGVRRLVQILHALLPQPDAKLGLPAHFPPPDLNYEGFRLLFMMISWVYALVAKYMEQLTDQEADEILLSCDAALESVGIWVPSPMPAVSCNQGRMAAAFYPQPAVGKQQQENAGRNYLFVVAAAAGNQQGYLQHSLPEIGIRYSCIDEQGAWGPGHFNGGFATLPFKTELAAVPTFIPGAIGQLNDLLYLYSWWREETWGDGTEAWVSLMNYSGQFWEGGQQAFVVPDPAPGQELRFPLVDAAGEVVVVSRNIRPWVVALPSVGHHEERGCMFYASEDQHFLMCRAVSAMASHAIPIQIDQGAGQPESVVVANCIHAVVYEERIWLFFNQPDVGTDIRYTSMSLQGFSSLLAAGGAAGETWHPVGSIKYGMQPGGYSGPYEDEMPLDTTMPFYVERWRDRCVLMYYPTTGRAWCLMHWRTARNGEPGEVERLRAVPQTDRVISPVDDPFRPLGGIPGCLSSAGDTRLDLFYDASLFLQSPSVSRVLYKRRFGD